MTTLSAFKSDSSSFFPFSMTSGCLRTSSQPMWAKKNPRMALWGSASVSEYLWWTRWSLAHSYMSFCAQTDRDSENYMTSGIRWLQNNKRISLRLHNVAEMIHYYVKNHPSSTSSFLVVNVINSKHKMA